jgi:hypothetical protein
VPACARPRSPPRRTDRRQGHQGQIAEAKDFSGSVAGEKGQCPNGPVLGGGYVLHVPSEFAEQKNLRAVRNYAIASDTWFVRALDNGASPARQLTVVAVSST